MLAAFWSSRSLGEGRKAVSGGRSAGAKADSRQLVSRQTAFDSRSSFAAEKRCKSWALGSGPQRLNGGGRQSGVCNKLCPSIRSAESVELLNGLVIGNGIDGRRDGQSME